MIHKHRHCQHPALKFCSHCNVVYCVDCGKEWFEQQVQYVYQAQPYQPWPKITWASGTAEVPAVDLTPKFTCSHHDGGQHAE